LPTINWSALVPDIVVGGDGNDLFQLQESHLDCNQQSTHIDRQIPQPEGITQSALRKAFDLPHHCLGR
jgi:hypothetical protein